MFGDNVPEERAESTKEAARNCDALLVVGSALMTMSAFRLARYHPKYYSATPLYKFRPSYHLLRTFFYENKRLMINPILGLHMKRMLQLRRSPLVRPGLIVFYP